MTAPATSATTKIPTTSTTSPRAGYRERGGGPPSPLRTTSGSRSPPAGAPRASFSGLKLTHLLLGSGDDRRGVPPAPKRRRTPEIGHGTGGLRLRAAVDVFEAEDVLLVELAEGDLQDARRALAGPREPVDRPPGYVQFFARLGAKDVFTQLHLYPVVEDHPQLVAAMMVLPREPAARLDRDDLDRRGQVVGVLLESTPRLVYLQMRRPVVHGDLLVHGAAV